jgi:Ca2+-transporting ATPase
MATVTLLLLRFAGPVAGVSAVVATTMGLTAFTLFQVVTGLTARSETQTMFTRDIFEDRRQVSLFGLSLALTFLVTQVGFLQRLFGTTALSGAEWLVCIGSAATLIVVDEVIKFFLRRNRSASQTPSSVTTPVSADSDVRSGDVDRARPAGVAQAS